MPSRRNYSAGQPRRTSQRTRNANTGARHSSPGSPSRGMGGSDIGYATSRRRKRAERGEVNFVGASSTTAESNRSYSRRTSHVGYPQGVKRSMNLRTIILAVLLVAVIIAVGAFVATQAFFGISDGKMGLSDKSAAAKLVPSQQDKPYYVLITADLDESNNCDTDVDAVMVARVDEKGKRLTCLSVPVALNSTFSDGSTHMLSEAVYYGGLGQLVSCVSSLIDADISHVVTVGERGLRNLVDFAGGVDWNVSEEVDDPYAGSIYIPTGAQKLSADQMMTLLRATNFAEGIQSQGINQSVFVAKMLQTFASSSKFDAASKVDKVAGSFKTDWTSDQLTNVLASFGGYSADSIYAAQIPSVKNAVGRSSSYSVESATYKRMLELFKEGSDPVLALESEQVSVDPTGVTVTVKNGAGITGGATAMAEVLTTAGYKVEDIGNTDSPVYNETLVIYMDDAKKDAATAIANVLGTKRVLDGTGRYTFDTDVLVILGSDWMPE